MMSTIPATALSPPQPLSGQRVQRISGYPGSTAAESADSGGSSMASAQRTGQTMRRYVPKRIKRKIRMASWNVGTLTGKSRELAEVLSNRKVHIACIQETKWKG